MLVGILGLGGPEIIALLMLGVLLFGRRLPGVGHSVGKTIVAFKNGMNGLEEEVESAGIAQAKVVEPKSVRPPERITSSVPRFEDSPSKL